MSPGETAVEFVENQVRMSIQVLASTNSQRNDNISISVPQTDFEKYANLPSSSVTIPATVTSNNNVRLALTSVSSTQFNYLDVDLNSNPLTISISSSASLCNDTSSSSCNFGINIQNSHQLDLKKLNERRCF